MVTRQLHRFWQIQIQGRTTYISLTEDDQPYLHGLFRCLELEIIRCRRPGVHLPNGTSTEDFKKRLDADIKSLPAGRYQTVCTDISEQDTTKTAAVHELVKRLFRIIGTPEHVIDILFSTLRAWAARGLDYSLWTLDAFQSGTAMTYLNNTIDNMARVGSAYNVATPFVTLQRR